MSSSDPWERRDVERRKFATRQQQNRPDLIDLVRNNARPLALLAVIVVLLVSEAPRIPGSFRAALLILGAASILGLLAFTRGIGAKFADVARSGANPLLIALAGVTLYSLFVSPFKVQASAEALRALCGLAVFAYTAYFLRNLREASVALGGILAFGGVVALADFATFGQTGAGTASWMTANRNAFGTHESIGSLLALLLPVIGALAFTPALDRARLAAQALSLVVGLAWILVRCRSAWVGGGLALLILLLLIWRFPVRASSRSREQRPRGLAALIASPLFLVAAAVIVLIAAGGVGPILLKRAGAMGGFLEDGSFQARLQMWSGGLRMLAERPIFGWGLAGYLVLQGEWTSLGDASWQVLQSGTDHQNIAHNYFIQWAADTGVVGLTLFLAPVFVLLALLLRGLPKVTDRLPRALILGAFAAGIGGLIESCGAPAWNFPGVWAIYWLILGVGVVALRESSSTQSAPAQSASAQSAPTIASRLVPPLAIALAAGISLGLVAVGKKLSDPNGEPRGTLQVSTDRIGPFRAGEDVVWRAKFGSGSGKSRGTFPGTDWSAPVWLLPSGGTVPATARSITLRRLPVDTERSEAGLVITLPAPPEPGALLSVQANYRDQYNRRYRASSVIGVE